MSTDRISKAFQGYKSAVYPQGISDEQEKQLLLAFHAGAVVIMGFLKATAELPDDDGVQILEQLDMELKRFAKERRAISDRRN